MDEPVTVPGIPLALRPLGDPAAWSITGPQALTAVAGPRTDWFVPPDGAGPPVMNAPAIVGAAPGDYLLSARVSVGFGATYDAGVLALHVDERCWAKLCFERAPDGTTLVVSVVTRDVSDDCNSFAVERDHVWLRIARRGPSFAFHASLDGRLWQLVRHFALGVGTAPELGFLAQSPTGEGCTVAFEEIAFEVGRLDDIRSGS